MPPVSSPKSRPYIRATLQALLFAGLGAIATIVAVAIFVINMKPELSVWHQAHLDEEFTAQSQITSLPDYLALEGRLFAQLNSDDYDKIADNERTDFNRYHSGSKSDPEIWPQNWNRTFELAASEAP